MASVEHRLTEFAEASRRLFWQRQATFAGATILAAYYVDLSIALICYFVCQISEFYDERLIREILNGRRRDAAGATRLMNRLTVGAALSSIAVVQYIVVIALAEGPVMHLGPLFFLFSAALYAAMNNSQLPRILVTRMAVYSAAFVFIPVYDIWVVRPPLDSDLWKQLGVVLFVLYFLIECSKKFLENYEIRMAQIEDLRIERDRVAEAYMVQSRFVSVVSHELRTPLTSIKASLDLITCRQLGELPDEIRAVAEIGQKSSNRLAVLIDDLLDFQKLRSGNLSFRFATVDLGQLVREAAEANQSLGRTRAVSIRVVGPDAPIRIKADPGRMMQVMTNVLSNAMKFSYDGGVVEVTFEPHDDKARVLIRDEGVGIPESAGDVVFEPFKQVDSSDKREFGGTGLGMSIARQIVEGHGGTITYVSRLGVGTTFAIELNRLPAEDMAAPQGRSERVQPAARPAGDDLGLLAPATS